ncbi:MAG TPA: thioredoxin domain-containing protein [Rhizomicrobium sp.]|jgi:protein-disulfide isomerase|nr:thioredoxin domain-containing protein [Rhizomicrobium sp.]
MNRNTILIGIIVLALIGLGVSYYLSQKQSSPDLTTTTTATGSTQITADDRTLGNPKAPIVMIEYAAPMCPICANFNANEFPRLKAQYIDTGKVFYIFRVFPIGAPDFAAEALARCLPKDQYFTFIDLLYRSQDKWDPDGHEIPDVRAALIARAGVAGMSAADAARCIDDKAEQARITKNAQDAQARFDVSGTPTFVVDGKVVYSGEYPWDLMKAMLDAEGTK